MHHPLTELVDGSHARRLLAERVDLVLRGHLPEPEPSMWSVPRRDLREAAAGCLYEHDRYPNGCQVIDVTLDDAGRALEQGTPSFETVPESRFNTYFLRVETQ